MSPSPAVEELRLDDVARAVDSYPALSDSRSALARAARGDPSPSTLVEVIEADPALVVATLRLANRGTRAGTVGSIPDAVAAVPSHTLAALAESVSGVDPFDAESDWGRLPERFRLHALGVAKLVERLFGAGVLEPTHELVTGALLHDIGELALLRAHPDFSAVVADAETPEDRLQAEREAFGSDHAVVGARLLRTWRLPERLATMVEGHHTAESGEAGFLRLADMLGYYAHGRAIDIGQLVGLAERLGLDRADLGDLLYELPHPIPRGRRQLEACPLSQRELEVLHLLSEAKLPKEIARELELAPSTVRNHLHRIYTRIGAADKAQAILVARERGWI